LRGDPHLTLTLTMALTMALTPTLIPSLTPDQVTSVAAIAVSLVLEEEVMSVIAAVNGVVSAGLFFLLGPYCVPNH